MTTNEAIKYIENFSWGKTKLGLSRTQALLEALGHPEKKLKFVHVAGSNGKGSTCSFVASVLARAGYKTGFYSSPYLVDFCERIQIFEGQESCDLADFIKISHPSLTAPSAPEPVVSDRSSQRSLEDCDNLNLSAKSHPSLAAPFTHATNITGEALARITEKVKKIADQMDDHPTQFEIITAIGFEYFFEEECDIVVLEVGMGGEFDATNVIDAPEVCVITNIGLEHTEYLGNTLAEIAAAKGGIIKNGCEVVCYDLEDEALTKIKSICEEKNANLTKADFSQIKSISQDFRGQKFSYKGKEYKIKLLGKHQQYNAATALETINTLRKKGYNISDEAVIDGFQNASWRGRFEVLSNDPIFIVDGGHNPQCAGALSETLKELFKDKKLIFIVGFLADKNYEKVIEIIGAHAKKFICLTPDSERALPADKLAKCLNDKGYEAEAILEDENCSQKMAVQMAIEEAKKLARAEDTSVVAFGSLYMAGLILKYYET